MKQLNLSVIEGNLVRDPETSTTKNGKSKCTFTIANNSSYKKDGEWQEDVNYLKVETWARLAETCSNYLEKGRLVRLRGRVEQSSFVGDDGQRVNYTRLVANHVDFLSFKKKKEDDKVSTEVA